MFIPGRLRTAEVVSALSQALDLGSGSSRWHSVRTCILGMRIAAELHLSDEAGSALYYALLLKDAGCSGNASEVYHALGSDDIAAKRDVKLTDPTRLRWESVRYALDHVAPGKPFVERVRAILRVAANQKRDTRRVTLIRCERGASLARLMGLPESTAEGINSLGEHWNGGGNPSGMKGEQIPLASRIMLLAETLDVFRQSGGTEEAVRVVKQRSRSWFDPRLVSAATSLAKRRALFTECDSENPQALALSLEPDVRYLKADDDGFDTICQAFAQIVDAKSPFTFNHSNGVANAAIAIARGLNLSTDRVLLIRHASLLHDLGKMTVPNTILEKAGKPDDAEWAILRSHPAYTYSILRCVTGFESLAEIAASHHEKLNGSGYHRGLTAAQLPTEARIIAVADVFDALAARRPYRDALPLEEVFRILRRDAPAALDAECVEALEQSGMGSDQTYRDLDSLRRQLVPAVTEVGALV